jgi:hypothetical protein
VNPDQSMLLTYDGLMDELQRSCIEKRTGTLLIATEDNQLARIFLHDGEITSLSYGLKNGMEAIAAIKEIKQARVKFSHGRVGDSRGGKLPATAEVLQILASERRTLTTTARPASKSVSNDQVPSALKVIETELVEFLGPLAKIVWSEHLERIGKPINPRQLPTLIDNLAKEIGDPTKVKRFKEQIWQKIGAAKTTK